jgi:DNA (cytosine-5)-methyltransferase 1
MKKKYAYYSEWDKGKAAWLRELIRRGAIAPGEVDERSIHDVKPGDLAGFAQCHFFAGIGVWSHALRQAGWPDSRECWTGSCPCPSFASNGKQRGFADPRHLWPEWARLVGEHRPPVVLGEQVEAAVGYGWWDLVAHDLERAGYAAGASVLTSAYFGGVDIRHRLYFVGVAEHAAGARLQPEAGGVQVQDAGGRRAPARRLAHAERDGEQYPAREVGRAERARAGQEPRLHEAEAAVDDGPAAVGEPGGRPENVARDRGEVFRRALGPGHWQDADWLLCRDRRWRPVEPGAFPLDHGDTGGVEPGGKGERRVKEMMLRGYGDAINAVVATEFVRAVMSVLPRKKPASR